MSADLFAEFSGSAPYTPAPFAVVRDPSDTSPAPGAYTTLQRLMAARVLKNFCTRPADERDGDSHEAALALMADLSGAGQARGWILVQAECAPAGLHSWLEVSGWVVDLSDTKLHPGLVMRREAFYSTMRPKGKLTFSPADLVTRKGLRKFQARWRATTEEGEAEPAA